MRVPNKNQRIIYSPDVDILMIHLSDHKVDDAYETDQMLVHVDEAGELVLLEIFNATKFLKEINQELPKNIQKKIFPEDFNTPVAHKIK